jgi:hypothetical protein
MPAAALSDSDRLIISGIVAWLQGAAQSDRANYSRGECAAALQRVLALPSSPSLLPQGSEAKAVVLSLHGGSQFMIDMDSLLRHAESFEDGKIDTDLVRKLILQHQGKETAVAANADTKRLRIAADALRYYASGGHIQSDKLKVANQPYIEPRRRAADALAAIAAEALPVVAASHNADGGTGVA